MGLLTDLLGDGNATSGAVARTYTKTAGQADDDYLAAWDQDGGGYVGHFRTRANSASGSYIFGIGTDLGAGGGILISHKNSGAGLHVAQQSSAGVGVYLKGYSVNPVQWTEVFAGSGGVLVEAKEGAAFHDGVTTQGSTTFTSATAAFTAGDVGSALVQQTSRGTGTDPDGAIPAGTTIVSVTNATTVVMSQAAAATGSGLLFRVASRAPAADLLMSEWRDTDATPIMRVRRNAISALRALTVSAPSAASTPLRANGAASQSTDIFQVAQSGETTTASFAINSAGKVVGRSTAYLANVLKTDTAPLTVQNFATGQRSFAIIGVASQTADQFAVMNESSVVQSRFDKGGFFMTRKTSAPADADLGTGEMALWFDNTSGAAKLMVKAKDAGGTVRTGQVALA